MLDLSLGERDGILVRTVEFVAENMEMTRRHGSSNIPATDRPPSRPGTRSLLSLGCLTLVMQNTNGRPATHHERIGQGHICPIVPFCVSCAVSVMLLSGSSLCTAALGALR